MSQQRKVCALHGRLEDLMSTPVLLKLRQTVELGSTDEAAIQRFIGQHRVLPAHHDVAWEGYDPTRVTILLEGVMSRYSTMADGRRQIHSFILPGDFCDLSVFLQGDIDHNVGTLTACTVASIDHQSLRLLVNGYPAVRDAL